VGDFLKVHIFVCFQMYTHKHLLIYTYTHTPPQAAQPTKHTYIYLYVHAHPQTHTPKPTTTTQIQNHEVVPADVILLAVHEPDPANPDGICYLETKSLDGETNLKLRCVGVYVSCV
jgi:hypothetical protein